MLGKHEPMVLANDLRYTKEKYKILAEKLKMEYPDVYKRQLQDIVRDKRYWETKRQNIRKREKQMEETIAKYEEELQELEKSRKEILRKEMCIRDSC